MRMAWRVGLALAVAAPVVSAANVHVAAAGLRAPGGLGAPRADPRALVRAAPADCPANADEMFPGRVSCFTLTVPRSYASPHPNSTFDLFAVRVRGTSPERVPVVYLEGGPGGSSGEAVLYGNEALSTAVGGADLIGIDQRGTGWSEPDMNCPIPVGSGSASVNGEMSEFEQIIALCGRLFREGGTDLDQIGTDSAARDIVSGLAALRVDRYDLYGASYGTTLGATIMSLRPSGLRSVVLDGVSPPELSDMLGFDLERVAEHALADCERQTACRRAYPKLRMQFESIVDRASTVGLVVTNESGKSKVIDRYGLFGEIYSASYSSVRYRQIPQMIDDLYRGRRRATLASDFVVSDNPYLTSYQMVNMTISCRESARVQAKAFPDGQDPVTASIDRPERLFLWLPSERRCRALGVARARVAEQPTLSTPTLLLSGGHDPITPSWKAERLKRRMDNATHLVRAGRGHVVGLSGDPCATKAVRVFFTDPSAQPYQCTARELIEPKFAGTSVTQR